MKLVYRSARFHLFWQYHTEKALIAFRKTNNKKNFFDMLQISFKKNILINTKGLKGERVLAPTQISGSVVKQLIKL